MLKFAAATAIASNLMMLLLAAVMANTRMVCHMMLTHTAATIRHLNQQVLHEMENTMVPMRCPNLLPTVWTMDSRGKTACVPPLRPKVLFFARHHARFYSIRGLSDRSRDDSNSICSDTYVHP